MIGFVRWGWSPPILAAKADDSCFDRAEGSVLAGCLARSYRDEVCFPSARGDALRESVKTFPAGLVGAMKRLSNALRIADIEFVMDAPPHTGPASWVAHDVNFERHRHQYQGLDHAFVLDVVHLKYMKSRTRWHAVLVTEAWRFSQLLNPPRTTKSIRIIQGCSSDVLNWMRQARAAKLGSSSLHQTNS